ncbi:hypothetical protein ACSVDM_25975 [Nocardia sp. JW2]|uniref:hypothetical protein n=1 Tax=Nocardia sp. JW2 TaxID=3450738 RepID=UPI003F43DDEA
MAAPPPPYSPQPPQGRYYPGLPPKKKNTNVIVLAVVGAFIVLCGFGACVGAVISEVDEEKASATRSVELVTPTEISAQPTVSVSALAPQPEVVPEPAPVPAPEPPRAPVPTPVPPPPAPPPAPAAADTTITRDGTYLVGSDIRPGTWRSDGTGSFCYWERMSSLTGGIDSIIDNGLGEGQQLVTILDSDMAFETQGCGKWTLIGE